MTSLRSQWTSASTTAVLVAGFSLLLNGCGGGGGSAHVEEEISLLSVNAPLREPTYVRERDFTLALVQDGQWARNLHLFGLLAFVAFIVVHVLMVVVHGSGKETSAIIFGSKAYPGWAVWLTPGALVGTVLLNWAATRYTLAYLRSTQVLLGFVTEGARKLLLHSLRSQQYYSKRELSPEHRVNGKPPTSDEYKIMAVHNFVDYQLEVGRLVENPMTFTLEDLLYVPHRADPEGAAQLRPGLDELRRMDRCASEADRRVGQTAPGGAPHLLPHHARLEEGRAERGRPGAVLRDHRPGLRVPSPMHPRLRDERGTAAHQAWSAFAAQTRDAGRLQGGQVDRTHRVRLQLLEHRRGDGRLARRQHLLRQGGGDLKKT